ncbi:hypothetical protein IscW_ISCW010578, partial [Ixodes scapularis]
IKREGANERKRDQCKAELALAEPRKKIAVGKLTARATTALGPRLCIAAATETIVRARVQETELQSRSVSLSTDAKRERYKEKERKRDHCKAELALAEPRKKIAVGKLTARATTALGPRLCIAAATETLAFSTYTSAFPDVLFCFIQGSELEDVIARQ